MCNSHEEEFYCFTIASARFLKHMADETSGMAAMWPERPSPMLANLAPNLSLLRKLQSRAMQRDSDCSFQEASTYACRLQHFQTMLFRCMEYLKETWLVYVPPGSKQNILDSVHKSYLRWIYYNFQARTRWEKVFQRDTSEIIEIRGWGKRAEGREEWRRFPRKTRAQKGDVASWMYEWMDWWIILKINTYYKSY